MVILSKKLSASGRKPITFDQGIEMMNKIDAKKYVECSALTQEGLKSVFEESVKARILFPPSSISFTDGTTDDPSEAPQFCIPIPYWTAYEGEYFIVCVLKVPQVQVDYSVVEKGLTVTVSVEAPPTDILKRCGYEDTFPGIEGSYLIPCILPLQTDAKYTTTVENFKFTIKKIKMV